VGVVDILVGVVEILVGVVGILVGVVDILVVEQLVEEQVQVQVQGMVVAQDLEKDSQDLNNYIRIDSYMVEELELEQVRELERVLVAIVDKVAPMVHR
jgi:hypothetical protein